MTNKHQVLETIKAHPDWNARRVAEALDCLPEYVRTTAIRNGVRVAIKKNRKPCFSKHPGKSMNRNWPLELLFEFQP